MKKLIALLLAAVMSLSLVACGGGEGKQSEASEETAMTMEELLEDAISTDMSTLENAAYENKVKAKQDYCDKPIIVSGTALKVEDDHVIICDGQVCLDAYLTVDDLAEIETGSEIKVVGIISDIQDMDMKWAEMTLNSPHYIMETAYLTE